VGYLTQEPSVFDGTIRENLLYGMRDTEELSNEKTIEMTIPLAKCERIYDLPN
jgi:ABC-type multidrug transport system fused ATPase/permease subunit